VKVWSATYTPFGGVHVSTGTLPSARFPGQWFQSESGLHQNWMRDYDPTTGRYLQADPLGLVDGASVYGYAKQNPGRWIDPTGELCRTVGVDKYGTEIIECDSGRNCPPGEDCNWRNPTENQRPDSEYNQCKRECEAVFDPENWTGNGPHKQCLVVGWLFGQVTRSKKDRGCNIISRLS
jgi:RHS repeat-associated protein